MIIDGKKQAEIIRNEIKKEISDSKDQLDIDVTKKISSEIEKAKSEVDSLTGSIKRDL
jgi:hypothetical protein